jgi:PadR family transcriptional regulator PadR
MPLDKLQGALDLLVLKILSRGPLHGYGVTDRVKRLSREVLVVEEGSLYPALHRMERDGLISAEWRTTDKGRRAKYYRLAPKGRKRLAREEKAWAEVTGAVARVLRFA